MRGVAPSNGEDTAESRAVNSDTTYFNPIALLMCDRCSSMKFHAVKHSLRVIQIPFIQGHPQYATPQ